MDQKQLLWQLASIVQNGILVACKGVLHGLFDASKSRLSLKEDQSHLQVEDIF